MKQLTIYQNGFETPTFEKVGTPKLSLSEGSLAFETHTDNLVHLMDWYSSNGVIYWIITKGRRIPEKYLYQ